MTHTATHRLAAALQAIDERFWLRHGLFWLVRTLLMAWLMVHVIHVAVNGRLALRDALLFLVPLVPVTYALLYGVLPALEQGRRLRFALLLAAWVPLSLALNYLFRFLVLVPLYQNVKTAIPDQHHALAVGPFLPLIITVGVAVCLRLYRQWRQRELANARLRQENYQAELQLLKAQIHPHFLFNTLNNLYALTLKQSDQAPEVVERLTGLLQFVVEQGDAPLVALRDEVALLRNYLALEQLRYGSRLKLDFAADHIPANGRIAPLLLLPLVENAFKHGSAEQLGQAHIRVALGVEGRRFTCVITNSKNEAPAPAGGKNGIGLRNVRQRLQLLYPHRHRFETEAGTDVFTVRLWLDMGAGSAAARAAEITSLPSAITARAPVAEAATDAPEALPHLATHRP
ncbi:sensor histidine kinase [Hymenobacter rubidus]|uniref:sensor histidine kinase n=1 Tax=Hymenobacter rubidus TaxID=1441626 RepID=UPI00191D2648|nr:histidine kinase [Hymenobacter rubidus]